MRKILMWIIFLVFLIPTVVLAAEQRRYLNIGGDPVCLNCPLQEGEEIRALPDDVFVQVRGRSGRIYTGWLKKGEELVVRKTENCDYGSECYVATRIYKCGNPLVGFSAPEGSNRILFVSRKPIVFEEAAPSVSPVSPPISLPESQPAVSPSQMEVSQPIITKCSPAVPVISGAVGSLAGLLSRNGWTGALLGAGGAIISNAFGSAILNCHSSPVQYLEAAAIGAMGGGLWGKSFHHHKKIIRVISPTPPGVSTGEFVIH